MRRFAKQVDGLIERYARRSSQLRATLEKVGLALAGRASARLRVWVWTSAAAACCG